MSFYDLIRLLSYFKPEDIHEKDALIREYFYTNNIDLSIMYK